MYVYFLCLFDKINEQHIQVTLLMLVIQV